MNAPIFVVGCPRSGTTLVQRILDQHPSISGGPESFILESLHHIERRRWVDLANLGVTQSQWRTHVRDLFSSVHEQRAQAKNKSRWADKTPAYALILDFIDDLYPDCQVIHVIRDPLDVIDSWRRRVGNIKARQAVHAWPEHVTAARAFGDAHSGDRYMEIRYEDLVAQPEKVMRPTMNWLGESWDDGILHLPPRKRTKPLEQSERTRRQRARWLGNPIEDDSSATLQADSAGVSIEPSKDPALQDRARPRTPVAFDGRSEHDRFDFHRSGFPRLEPPRERPLFDPTRTNSATSCT